MIVNKIQFENKTKFIVSYKGNMSDRALEVAAEMFSKVFPQDSYIILSEDTWKITAIE